MAGSSPAMTNNRFAWGENWVPAFAGVTPGGGAYCGYTAT